MGMRVVGRRPRPVVRFGAALLAALLVAPVVGGFVSAQEAVEEASVDAGRATIDRRNSTAFAIRDNSNALPYSTEITIRGRPGKVEDVDVYIYDLHHNSPEDIDILLASPDGRAVIVMSDAGGEDQERVSGVNLIFDQQAAREIPNVAPGFAIQSGRYKPTNRVPDDDSFGPPAPAPTGTSLNNFNGINPNGTWRLFIRDDEQNNLFGALRGGWGLRIETTNTDPTATTDRYTAKQGEVLHVSGREGLLRNDTDPDGDRLRVISVPERPNKGQVKVRANGGFTYRPRENEVGRDRFRYKIRDEAGNTAVGKVLIDIRRKR